MTATGSMIMAAFAAAWWVVGTKASGHGTVFMYGIPLFSTLAVAVAASRRRAATAPASAEEESRRGRLVGIASGVEGLAIFVAVNVLANTGKREFTAPVVAIIVGLHFLPLARWLPAPLYYATSALLVALGIAGLSIPDANQRLFAVSLGAACILWVTSAAVLIGRAG